MSTNKITKIITTAEKLKRTERIAPKLQRATINFKRPTITASAPVKQSLWGMFKGFVKKIISPHPKALPQENLTAKITPHEPRYKHIEFQRQEMQPNFIARRAYRNTDRMLHAQTPVNAQTIDRNIIKTTETNTHGWDSADMLAYYRDIEKNGVKLSYEESRALRAAQITKPNDVHLKVQGPSFTSEERRAVCSYQDNYHYNSYLRAGKLKKAPEEIPEIQIMDRIVKDAPKTTEDCVVLRGVRTRKPYDPEYEFSFAKDIKKGAIITDKSFVSTARKNCPLQEYFDPILQIPNKDYPMGFVERITIPKGSQVIDCGRGGMYSDEIIFGRNSMMRIDEVDDVNHIVYKTFLGYAD